MFLYKIHLYHAIFIMVLRYNSIPLVWFKEDYLCSRQCINKCNTITLAFSELGEVIRGQEKLRPIKCSTNAQQPCINLLDCTSFSLCFTFIRCEISGPVTDSRGFSPKPRAEVLQSYDGEMRLRNRGSCKSVRQDPRCVQLCPVKTLLPV